MTYVSRGGRRCRHGAGFAIAGEIIFAESKWTEHGVERELFDQNISRLGGRNGARALHWRPDLGSLRSRVTLKKSYVARTSKQSMHFYSENI